MAESLVFVSPSGTVTDLKSLPGVRALGDQGFEMPAFRFVEDEVAGGAGSQLRTVRTLARDVTVPFLIEESGHSGPVNTHIDGGRISLPIPNGYTYIGTWVENDSGYALGPRAYSNAERCVAQVSVHVPVAGRYEVVYEGERNGDRGPVDVSVNGSVLRRLPMTETGTTDGSTVRTALLVGTLRLEAGSNVLEVRRVDDGTQKFVSFFGFSVTPVFKAESAQVALRTLLRTLARQMNPQAGDGRLRHTAEDGAVRELTCRYVDGLEGDRVRGQAGPNYRRGALVFRAHDPYWSDTTGMSSTFGVSAAAPFYADSPFFGLRLTSDVVIGTQTVDNTGDVETWPVWTVVGPSTSVTVENLTTGARLHLPVPLNSGQSLVIDTRPLRKTVRRNDGANLFGQIDGSLWSLMTGPNRVTISLPGATTASYVTLDYQRRWLSP